MKKSIQFLLVASLFTAFGCKQNSETPAETTTEIHRTESAGQSVVKDETSSPNIVQTASGSKDHTTFVTAVKAAGLVDALSNAGPIYCFCTNKCRF